MENNKVTYTHCGIKNLLFEQNINLNHPYKFLYVEFKAIFGSKYVRLKGSYQDKSIRTKIFEILLCEGECSLNVGSTL